MPETEGHALQPHRNFSVPGTREILPELVGEHDSLESALHEQEQEAQEAEHDRKARRLTARAWRTSPVTEWLLRDLLLEMNALEGDFAEADNEIRAGNVLIERRTVRKIREKIRTIEKHYEAGQVEDE